MMHAKNRTDIGAWYITYNNEKMWSNNFGTGNPIRYRALLSENPTVFGIPDSSNVADIDFQLSKMAELGIDFILYDITNGGLTTELRYGKGNEWIVDNALLTCERLAKWNKEHPHKIRYALAIGVYPAIRGNKYDNEGRLIVQGVSIGECAEVQAEAIYKQFYMDAVIGGDNYYHLNGKPLLVLHDWGENVLTVPHGWNAYEGTRTYGDCFTVRNGQKAQSGTYGWQTTNGTQIHPEVEVVCPGWENAWGNAKIARENGEYYRRNWQIILDNPLPQIVMIVSLNDYNESCGIFPADTSQCDNVTEEQWLNSEGKLDSFLYWDITREYIEKLRQKQNERRR